MANHILSVTCVNLEWKDSMEILTINNIDYDIRVDYAYPEKVATMDYYLGLKIAVKVMRVSDKRVFTWKEIKGTYIAEKISDYVKNTINGQRTFYWKEV